MKMLLTGNAEPASGSARWPPASVAGEAAADAATVRRAGSAGDPRPSAWRLDDRVVPTFLGAHPASGPSGTVDDDDSLRAGTRVTLIDQHEELRRRGFDLAFDAAAEVAGEDAGRERGSSSRSTKTNDGESLDSRVLPSCMLRGCDRRDSVSDVIRCGDAGRIRPKRLSDR